MITRLGSGTWLRSATASDDDAAEGMTDEMHGPPVRRMTVSMTSASSHNRWIWLGAPLGRSAVPEQARRHAAECPFQPAITGRQAAPVLHDPGTSTTVGPCPRSS